MSEATAAPGGATSTTAKRQEGEYVVLRMNDSGFWEEMKRVAGSSATAAVRKFVSVAPKEDEPETFVAVPVRSWQPVVVSAKVETSLQIEAA